MEWGVIAPPSPPGIVWPRPTNRPKHVTAHDPGSDIRESARHEVVIDARLTALAPSHLVKRSGGEDHLVQGHATDTDRVREVLIRTCAVAVDRDCEAVDPQLTHEKRSDRA